MNSLQSKRVLTVMAWLTNNRLPLVASGVTINFSRNGKRMLFKSRAGWWLVLTTFSDSPAVWVKSCGMEGSVRISSNRELYQLLNEHG